MMRPFFFHVIIRDEKSSRCEEGKMPFKIPEDTKEFCARANFIAI